MSLCPRGDRPRIPTLLYVLQRGSRSPADGRAVCALTCRNAACRLEQLGRYDDALRDLREARDLAERVGGDWLAAGARVQLGILDVVRGSLDEARPLLEEALDLSLAARSTSFVTLCLAGYAWLAFADGDPGRAALLGGAAEGLRRRVGLSAWPHLRKLEVELVAQVRHTLGAARFDRAFSAGSGLAQQQAVAIVRDRRGTGTQTS
jgi:tetratricopeptide (TPR) repeat protein